MTLLLGNLFHFIVYPKKALDFFFEFARNLTPGQFVLDAGSGSGSWPAGQPHLLDTAIS